jgi:diguanylate cyclase (GGDEF)-like protein/PAS domain S-box-containing protein
MNPRTLVGAIGLAIAIVTALLIPAGYFLVGYTNKASVLEFKGKLSAERIGKYIYTHGTLWRYQSIRLSELIEDVAHEDHATRKRIVGLNGDLILDEGADLNPPTMMRQTPIIVAGDTVGYLELESSMRRLLAETAMAAVLSSLLGLAIFFVLRIFPLRILDRTLGELKSANEAIQDRNRLLKERNQTLVVRDLELQERNRRFDAALNNMTQGLCMFDRDARLVVCNQRYLEMYGLSPEVVKPGCTLAALMAHRKATGSFSGDPALYAQNMIEALEAGETVRSTIDIGDGRIMLLVSKPMPHGGWVATHEDITERRRAEAEISFLAHHDALTGLPNRPHFRERMEKALANIRLGDSLAVLCIDLDRFKQVNDTLGHPIGDRLLQAAAERMRNSLREEDMIARFGGDEFAILQVGADQPDGATGLANRIIEKLSQPFTIEGQQIDVGCSVGIAIAPGDSVDVDRLIRNADMALYRAKADGKGTFHFFERDMDARMQNRRTLELDLRKAIVNGELKLFYQPIIALDSQRLSGFEALLRWNHPTRGFITPDEFVPLAEQVGLIVPIGEWVLQEACLQAAKWPENLYVAVNLSAVQFRTRALLPTVVNALAHSGLSPKRLEVEITETVLLQNEETVRTILHQFHGLGIRIAMDDFGTGYSSLGYLQSFPFDKIKIDRSFVQDLSTRSDCRAIVQAIAGLGASLGISVTAEGIETLEQLKSLQVDGCTEGQGYLFSPAVPVKDLGKLIDRMNPIRQQVA